MVLLSGEPGVGKTRLADEALTRARTAKSLALVGRCFEQQSSIPFFPFSEAFAAAWKVAPPELVLDAEQRWPELGFIVPDLLLPTGGAPPAVESEATQLRVFKCASLFLAALAQIRPAMLVLDDLQWADATSLSLLLYLARHLADSLLIVGIYRELDFDRNHPLHECLRELVRERVVEEIHLVGLARDGTGALVRARLGEQTSDEFVRTVHERTGGNPFFAHELVKALLEQGPARQGRRLTADTIDIPRSVRAVIGGRVAKMPSRAQQMMALASVIGQEFDLELLAAPVRDRRRTVRRT